MISIVISSYRRDLLEDLKLNIAETIGIDYEIIAIENVNQIGICEAYNNGAEKASYPFICFMHEDVIMHTKDWGKKVIAHFHSDEKIGLIGLLGAAYKTAAPSSWFVPVDPKKLLPGNFNLLQRYGAEVKTAYENPLNETITRVATIDGVWMCCKKSLWQHVKFDQNTIEGFHSYDISFSIEMNKLSKVVVVYDVLLEHFSAGNLDKKWMEATYKVHKRFKSRLPINYSTLSNREIFVIENDARDFFLRSMYRYHVHPLKVMNVIWGVGSFKFFSPGRFFLRNKNFAKYLFQFFGNTLKF